MLKSLSPKARARARTAAFILSGLLAGVFLGARIYDGTLLEYRSVKAELRDARKQLADQQQRLINLDIADKVNKLTQEKLRNAVTDLKTQQLKLEGELFLYKNLVEDDDADIGLNLESVTIRAVPAEEQKFSYQIVVRRKVALSQSVNAVLSLSIDGKTHGIRDNLSLKEVDSDISEDVVDIRFKYFKVLQGQLRLPPNFNPEKLVITLYEEGRPDSLIIRELPWRLAEF